MKSFDRLHAEPQGLKEASMKKRILSAALALAMCLSLLPHPAFAADVTDTTWTEGTYDVTGEVTLEERVTVSGDVTLNLNEGCKLTASKGIEVQSGKTLYIQGSGELVATGGTDQDGIGGAGYVYINSGLVTATGGEGADGIGCKFRTANAGTAVVFASSIKDTSYQNNWRGVIFNGSEGVGSSSFSDPLPVSFTIPEGYTLTIPTGKDLYIGEGMTLTNNGTLKIEDTLGLGANSTLINNGTLDINAGGYLSYATTAAINGDGTFATKYISNSWIDVPDDWVSDGTTDLSAQIAEKVKIVILGKEFTYDTSLWTLGVQQDPDFELGYIITFTPLDETNSPVTKRITVKPPEGQYAAAVENADGTTRNYPTFEEAWNAANESQDSTLTLLRNWTTKGVEVSNDKDADFTLKMADGVTLTSIEFAAIYVYGNRTMENCSVSSVRECLVVSGSDGGSAVLRNCDFETTDSAKNTISINNYNSKLYLGDLLAEGYAYKQDGSWLASTALSETKLKGHVQVLPIPAEASVTGAAAEYGSDATLTATVTGVESGDVLTYQWYDSDGIAISGATEASYTTAGLNAGTHEFSCGVTWNGYNLKKCEPAAVTVTPKVVKVSGINGTHSKTYDGNTSCDGNGLSLTLDGVVGNDDVSVTASSFLYDSPDAGENKIVTACGFQLTGNKAENYIIAADQTEFSASIGVIEKAVYSAASIPSSCKFGASRTCNLSVLPEGAVLGEVEITENSGIFDGNVSIAGQTLSYKLVDDDSKIGETGTITVPVTGCKNYKDFTLTITVTVTEKEVPVLSVIPITVTYSGNPVSNNHITGSATVNGVPVDGNWQFAPGQSLTNTADSGPKDVIFIPKDIANFEEAQGTVTVTINKASPSLTLTPSPVTLPNGGTVTLSLSGLPAGASASVTCSDEGVEIVPGADNTWSAAIPSGGASRTFTAAYAGDDNHYPAEASCTVRVEKNALALSLQASPDTLRGGGSVTLSLSGLPAGESAAVTCSDGISVTKGLGNTWSATLPNSTAVYTFTAEFAGNDVYKAASASCTVEVKEVVILPDHPAEDGGTKFQLTMETGISEVPAELQKIDNLNTPEKLEIAMKTEITQLSASIPQENIDVYDVELLVSVNGGAWIPATKENFPSGGLTVTLPYPEGTDSSYRFTVVHMFTTSDFGKKPGETEMPNVSNTSDGIQFTVNGLSPISVGWEKASNPSHPSYVPSHSGSTSPAAFAVTVQNAEHGEVTASRASAVRGSTVTLTVTPDSGYVLDTLTVTDSRWNEIELTPKGDNQYTFTMPGRAITVSAAFVPLPETAELPCDGGADCPAHGFTDLDTDTWYHEAVDYILRNGLMSGYGDGRFGPNEKLSRAQLAQILNAMAGRPVVNYLMQFTDVPGGEWYTEAVRWAASTGVITGYDGRFGPDDNITRQQLAVMLWRYAGSPAAANKELYFTDAAKTDAYALDAMRWAVENGILNGYSDGRLNPTGLATRAEAAAMLMRYSE